MLQMNDAIWEWHEDNCDAKSDEGCSHTEQEILLMYRNFREDQNALNEVYAENVKSAK